MRAPFAFRGIVLSTLIAPALFGCTGTTDSVQVASVSISNPAGALYVGGNLQFSAHAVDSHGTKWLARRSRGRATTMRSPPSPHQASPTGCPQDLRRATRRSRNTRVRSPFTPS